MDVTIIDWNWSVYMKDIMHLVSQVLLVPVMAVLIAFLVYTVFSLGSLAVEYLTEQRRFRVNIPDFIEGINKAAPQEIVGVIEDSGLLSDQKLVLVTVARSIGLPKEDLFALAKAELAGEREMYDIVTGRNDLVARVAPVLGLLGTLIPLGPGIVAMGQGEVDQLAASLLIAFDSTIAGLVASVLFLVIARFRKRWYARYMLALETGVRCLLQKAELTSADDLSAIEYSASLSTTRMNRAQARAVGVPYKKPKNRPSQDSKHASEESELRHGL